MPSINSISAKNYKGFGSLDLTIKPLTVLLGSNSCGKSSIINLILMLTQSIDTQEELLSPLRINGLLVGLGEPDNIIRGRDEKNILEISISIDDRHDNNSSSYDYSWMTFDTCREEFLSYLGHFIRKATSDNNTLGKTIINKDILNYNETDNNRTYKSISLMLKKIRDADKTTKISCPSKGARDYLINSKYQRTRDILEVVDSVSKQSTKAKSFHYSIQLSKESKKKLSISTMKILNDDDKIIISIDAPKNGGIKITSDIIDNGILKNSKNDILDSININSLTFSKKQNEHLFHSFPFSIFSKNPVASFVASLIDCCAFQLQDGINKNNILHVSPLRAFPQRYYLLDKTIRRTELDTANGTELAEILKRNTDVLLKINNLLSTFDLKMRVDNINDVIHKITVIQDNVELEITDVGFGISQVIPILVQAFISPPGSITIIEQPEIHLHPRMQAWLVDALIEEALSNKKRFIIETHSESIIRRIRRRVVENTFNLRDSDVIIYDIQKDKNQCSFLKEIEIKSNGDILWPDGFLDIEIEDLKSIQKAKRDIALKGIMTTSNKIEGE